MIVTLSSIEMATAAQVGVWRQLQALKEGRPDRHGFEGDGWSVHIEGACGELAAAKALGVYWPATVGTFKAGGDVGDLQVRTRSKHEYELIVRPDDSDDAKFILVTGRAPEFIVGGWILGRNAKMPAWSKTHGGRPAAFFVPPMQLNPLSSLKAAA